METPTAFVVSTVLRAIRCAIKVNAWKTLQMDLVLSLPHSP
jgi:hypothetical protein